MASIERLEAFYPFDQDVLDRVGEVSAWQNCLTFEKLAFNHGIEDGPQIIPADKDHKAFEVLRLIPKNDYDATHARVYHLPMSLPIDENMSMRAMRMFGADSAEQLILVGNPGAAGQQYGKLRLRDMKTVWDGDLTPIVDPFLAYLHEVGVETTDELGFSYGADKSATSSTRAAAHDISVKRGVWMESAAVDKRGPGLIGLARLGIDFMSAGAELDNYVEANHSKPLNEAREIADPGLARYLLGLGRLSNLVIANSLAHGGFQERARDALKAQPELQMTLAWGTESELTTDSAMSALANRLRAEFGWQRIKNSLQIQGMHHGGGDDIDLHAAIVLQALKS